MWTEHGKYIALFLPLWTVSAGGQTQGRITGTVQDNKGRAVGNAFVSINNQRSPQGIGNLNSSTRTAADGTFVFASVPPGSYRVCIQIPRSLFLDPCQWSTTPPTATVGSGQTVGLGVIQMQAGQALPVEMMDDSGDLDKNEGKTAGASILIGVWGSNGLFQPARLKGRDATTHHYELVVPYDIQLGFSVQSNFFKLSDQNDTTVDGVKGSQVTVQIPSGTAPQPLVYHVKGVKP